MKNFYLAYASIALFYAGIGHAAGLDSFHAFIKDTAAIRANFKQTVSDAQGKKLQEVQGTMSLLRQAEAPGKFRWDYSKPYEQQIVGDGTRVWLYDPDLNQVTVRPMDKALGSTPAALLAGSQQLENTFVLVEEPKKDGLEWVRATAKEPDSGFEKIYLGFKGQNLQAMQLYDNFGNLTRIQFSKLERNPKIAEDIFHFKPPPNADIVGE